MKRFSSHGTGEFERTQLRAVGEHVVIEAGVRIFHPETVSLGENVYVGHDTILKGYFKGSMEIGAGVWIGQQCFFHSAGGITIGRDVGIGPGVRILTSTHTDPGPDAPIMHGAIEFAPVVVGDGCDLGVGATLLPGVTLGRGVQVGAGAVVADDLPDLAVAAGVPARVLRFRDGREVTP
jgi:acetyltransferase-like isoleucine patch superfamily enzyme